MRTAFELLATLTDRLAPPVGFHHNITLAEDGKNIILSLATTSGFHRFNIDDTDLDKDSDTLADEVLELFRRHAGEKCLAPGP